MPLDLNAFWYEAPLVVPAFLKGELMHVVIPDNHRLGTYAYVPDGEFDNGKSTYDDCPVETLELSMIAQTWMATIGKNYADKTDTVTGGDGDISGIWPLPDSVDIWREPGTVA